MRKTAGLLKFCCSFALIIEIFVTVIVALIEIFLLISGNFSELAAKTGNAVSVSAGSMSPEEMDAMRPFILIALLFALAGLVFVVIGTLKTRTALSECKENRPFSAKSVQSLKTSARMEIASGVIGIIASLILSFMASGLKVNGSSAGSSSGSASLSFLFYAVLKYLLYHVAEYGHSLETNQDRL